MFAPVLLSLLLATPLIAAAAPPPPPQQACGPAASPFAAPCAQPQRQPPAAASLAALGKALFSDGSLSASGKQSCASCHSPADAFSPPDAAPVAKGGADLSLPGLRSAPGLSYVSFTPPFAAAAAGRPAHGGFMRDGRVATLAQQAQQPFLVPFEMANIGAAQVLQRLLASPSLTQFTAVFGSDLLKDADATLAAIGRAIAAYEAQDTDFRPFSSKYDAYVDGRAALSAQEAAGLQAFTAPDRGHCASCHRAEPPAGAARGAQPALFTDFSFHVLGVPRNWRIPYNLDGAGLPAYVPANGQGLGAPGHAYYDLGLCGPLRTDLAADTSLCGAFKVPTLRNVAQKRAYFHNGVFGSLQEVVSWYATRNSNPGRWYKKADGSADILYNDLPVIYAGNVEPRNRPGHPIAPNLGAADIRNVIAFLCTLNDGFDPANPGAYNRTGQCRAP